MESGKNIIHFAAHGSKDGIYLHSKKENKKNLLSMSEVQDLAQGLYLQNTKMVVLSACDTFKGDLRSDGVVGITRAFLAKGSSTVVASLWPVSDESTKELMAQFYENLQLGTINGKDVKLESVDVPRALQKAIVSLMNEKGRDKVRLWAPFLVYGL